MTEHLSPYSSAGESGGTPFDRDRYLRRATRLRRTVVGTSIAATLGIAGLVGAGVGHSVGSTGASTGTAGGSTQSSAQTAVQASGESDDSGGTSAGTSAGTAPSLLGGSGTSHATTTAS